MVTASNCPLKLFKEAGQLSSISDFIVSALSGAQTLQSK